MTVHPYLESQRTYLLNFGITEFGKRTRNFTVENFWAQGYFVSTVGLDEVMVREYIRDQEERDKYFEQMSLLER